MIYKLEDNIELIEVTENQIDELLKFKENIIEKY